MDAILADAFYTKTKQFIQQHIVDVNDKLRWVFIETYNNLTVENAESSYQTIKEVYLNNYHAEKFREIGIFALVTAFIGLSGTLISKVYGKSETVEYVTSMSLLMSIITCVYSLGYFLM
jgi:hypothetical protein